MQRGAIPMMIAALMLASAQRVPAQPACTSDLFGVGADGSVVDRQTGAPIEGAAINAGGDSPGISGADGCFVAPGDYSGPCAYYDPSCAPSCILDCPISVSVSAAGYEGVGFTYYTNHFPVFVRFRLAALAAVECRGDADQNGGVSVDEIVSLVADGMPQDVAGATTAALNGCLDCDFGCSAWF